jgi:hypothetical protein
MFTLPKQNQILFRNIDSMFHYKTLSYEKRERPFEKAG